MLDPPPAALRLFPCAIEILSFQNFCKVLKTCSAGRKNFRHAEKGTADFRCSFCIYASKTISRVLYLTVIYLDVPLPVRSSHPGSGRASLGTRSPCSHTGVAPDRVYSDGLFPAIECALTALFHPYLVITSSISFRILRLTPVTPKRTQQSGSERKRRSDGMNELRLCQKVGANDMQSARIALPRCFG